MKRIALLVCGIVLALSNTAEARRNRWNGTTYTTPTYTTPAYATPVYNSPYQAATTPAAAATPSAPAAATNQVAPAAYTASAVNYSTSTAQGVANLMASYNRVGHFGGNPGYEGCGCGATPAAAYSICCYGNSGMATVDVGYAQSASGMWYCCRRYR
jgi:hypothetical protein